MRIDPISRPVVFCEYDRLFDDQCDAVERECAAMSGEWLSLSQVAEMLGVHPSTVRNWSDHGRLPVHRTQGGHRRYRRSELELWLQAQGKENLVDADQVLQRAVNLIRVQINEGRLENETWYQKLDQEARDHYRRSGQALFQGLVNFLSTDSEHEAMAEARSLGYEYASRGNRYGLTMAEATKAFLFFRDALMESVLDVYASAQISAPNVWAKMLHKINVFTDQALVAFIEMFQAYKEGKR
jgi:excisionase family DNA binding protein